MPAFCPRVPSSTVLLVAGAASGRVALDSVATVNVAGRTVRVYNSGVVPAFLNFGGSGVTAAVTDMPIAPGVTEVFTIPHGGTGGSTHVAAITSSGTPTLYFTLGDGE